MEGIIRELDSFNRKKGRRKILYGVVAGFVGGLALAGGLWWIQENRISKLEEEKTELETELNTKLTTLRDENKELEDQLSRIPYYSYYVNWEEPRYWENYVEGFFKALTPDPFNDKVFPIEGNHEFAASQLYNAMRKHYHWKERDWFGFLRAFERTYFDDVSDTTGKEKYISYRPLAPDWYEILSDPKNTDYEDHKKGFTYLMKKFASSTNNEIESNGNLHHLGTMFAKHFESEIETTTGQITFTRRVTNLFEWVYDYFAQETGKVKIVVEEIPEGMPEGYK